ncbi:adenylate kinase [Lysobacter sp. Hz 25]|uniref:deoxynucleotide monophosphate kinase family protein n=1 Tax=Lysobacter sp. Hz 25 TaxID=3383698 RepID=UPI0038D46C2D
MEHHGFAKITLAGPIRSFVAELTGLTIEQLTDGPLKEEPLTWLGGITPRRMMQTLGTEWGREMIADELWLIIAQRTIERAKRDGKSGVVVSDVRFDNEAEFVQSLGGRVIELVRDEAVAVSEHVSEAGVSRHLLNGSLRNDGPRHRLAYFASLLAA